jgi:serine/threonine protein kinase
MARHDQLDPAALFDRRVGEIDDLRAEDRSVHWPDYGDLEGPLRAFFEVLDDGIARGDAGEPLALSAYDSLRAYPDLGDLLGKIRWRFQELGFDVIPDPFPGEFRLIRTLGRGSFGSVWLANDLKLGRQVALKSVQVPCNSTHGPLVLQALTRDARALAAVDHPHIVRVYGWRDTGTEPYLVLQYIEGGTLQTRLENEGVMAWPDAVLHIANVGEALGEAHGHGVVHRDIKPANILWDAAQKQAKLTDFGVAAHLTESGSVVGTPAYMPPEALEGRVTPKLDVFSLAVTLFQLVVGDLPFPEPDPAARLAHIHRGLQDDPRLGAFPEPLEKVVRDSLAAYPSDRLGLRDFLDSLRNLLNSSYADSLTTDPVSPSTAPVHMRLTVYREVAPALYQPVPTMPPRPIRLTRGMKKGSGPSGLVRLRTGDKARIEVVADRAGYLTVFNVGPDGELNPLYPDPGFAPHRVPAHEPLWIDDVDMTPPEGRERLFAVWTREPAPLRPEDLERVAGLEDARVSRAYRATRGMQKFRQSLERLPVGDYHAVVLELDHIKK